MKCSFTTISSWTSDHSHANIQSPQGASSCLSSPLVKPTSSFIGPAFVSSLTGPPEALTLGAVRGWMVGGLSLHCSRPGPAGDSRLSALLHCPHCSEAAGPLSLTVQQGPWDSPSRKKRTQNERKPCHALRRTFLKIPDHTLSHHSPECVLRLRVVSVDNFEAFFSHWLTYRP